MIIDEHAIDNAGGVGLQMAKSDLEIARSSEN